MGSLRALLSLAVVLLVACEGPQASLWPTEPEASAVPAASDSGGPVSQLTEGNLALPPGRYTRSAFEPQITIALKEGWRAVQLFDGFFDVQQQVGSPDVIAVQFANVRGVHGAEGASATTDPDEAVEILGTNSGLTVLETSESRMGGLTGAQVTVENAGAAHAEVMDVPPGPLGIDPGRRLWIAFFETGYGLLAIMVGGSVERWDEALLTAEPVLESVEIGAR
jgi:hypothetical protein